MPIECTTASVSFSAAWYVAGSIASPRVQFTLAAHAGGVGCPHDGSPERESDVTRQLRDDASLQIRLPRKPEPPQTRRVRGGRDIVGIPKVEWRFGVGLWIASGEGRSTVI